MLLQFTVENFQSIKQRTTLDMMSVGGKEITEFKNSLLREKYLPKAVIYGPNGGGKTTLLRAFLVMQILITSYSNFFGGIQIGRPIPKPQVNPFKFDKDSVNKPTLFEILIEINKIQYKYGLSVFRGAIKEEYLYEKKENLTIEPVFIRNGQVIEKSPVEVKGIAPDMPLLVFIRQFYDVQAIKEVVDFFLKTCFVDYNVHFQAEALMINIFDIERNPKLSGMKIKILKMFSDIGIKVVNYSIDEKPSVINNQIGKEFTVKTKHNVNNEFYELMYHEESNGTQKLFTLIPLFISSLTEGRVIFVDELDAKLHPKLLEYVIKLYSDKEINVGSGQLIFTSHDMTTMNKDIFRRDEIYFMSLSESQDSELFSLVEIRGKDGRVVRNDGSFSKQYLEGRYGADPYYIKMKSW